MLRAILSVIRAMHNPLPTQLLVNFENHTDIQREENADAGQNGSVGTDPMDALRTLPSDPDYSDLYIPYNMIKISAFPYAADPGGFSRLHKATISIKGKTLDVACKLLMGVPIGGGDSREDIIKVDLIIFEELPNERKY